MTITVATAQGDTPDELYANVRVAAAYADWVEVRLDGPSGFPWDLRPWFGDAIDKPTLATLRAHEDGGHSNADDETRAALLQRALLAGAHAIDVEFANDAAKSLLHEAHERGALVVMSLHDLEGTPDDIIGTLRKMRALGADHAKVATRINTPSDAARLVVAARAAQREAIPFALMAVNDPLLRLAAPTLGMSLAYGSVPGQPAAAPGQVPVDELKRAHVGQPAKLAFLLGHPVAHSKSPPMQDAAFHAAGIAARYLAADITDLPAAVGVLRALRPLGANVTVPHKEAIVPLLDDLAASAKSVGAVNTLEFSDGRVIGHNTDGGGALDALQEVGFPDARGSALIVGAGGTGRAIAHALSPRHEVTITNRTMARAETIAKSIPQIAATQWSDAMGRLDAFDLVVNATTVGMHGDAMPFPAARLDARATLLDCVYRADGTPLARAAQARGLRVVRGEAMLLHQGARAFRIWTGRDPDISAMRRALA